MLEQATDLNQVLEVDHAADALQQYVRLARLGLEEQNRVAALRVRAAHRAGALLRRLADDPRRPPRRPRDARRGGPRKVPNSTLAKYSITGQQSSIWQAIASIDMPVIQARLNEIMAGNGEVTVAEFARLGRPAKRHHARQPASATELRLRGVLATLGRVTSITSPCPAGPGQQDRRRGQRLANEVERHKPAARQPIVPTIAMLHERLEERCLGCGRGRPGSRPGRCPSCNGTWLRS